MAGLHYIVGGIILKHIPLARNRLVAIALLLTALFSGALMAAADVAPAEPVLNYSARADVIDFIDELVRKDKFSSEQLESWFAEAQYQQSIIDVISRPAEKRLAWWGYRRIFLQDARIQGGMKFWLANEKTLTEVAKKYKVDPEIIVSILGVETLYGQRAGSYRVIDALATLGFDYPPRSKFFRKELRHFFLLIREEDKDPFSFKGSYAGAMGYGQFIPSSYREYAVDFDQDGLRDIWQNVDDSVASIANYLKRHRWHQNDPVVHPVKVSGNAFEPFVNKGMRRKGLAAGALVSHFKTLGVQTDLPDNRKVALIRLEDKEGSKYWLAEHNFFVITTYNISRLYAMAVYDLSKEIKQVYCAKKASQKQWAKACQR